MPDKLDIAWLWVVYITSVELHL